MTISTAITEKGEMMRLIDADEFRRIFGMAEHCDDCKQDTRNCQYDMVFTRMDICGWLDDVPTVDPVKHGRWIRDYEEGDYHCSVCNAIVESVDSDEWYRHYWRYCYNCGAKMDEVEE